MVKRVRCKGVSSFGEFRALVNQLAALEPVSAAIRSPKRGRLGEVPESLQKAKVLELAHKFDALLHLLDATADALAAAWDQQGRLYAGAFTVSDNSVNLCCVRQLLASRNGIRGFRAS